MTVLADPAIVLRQGDAGVVVCVSGEFDLCCQTRWTAAFADACRDGGHRVSIDLGAVTFIDSSGLDMLLTARSMAASNSVALELVNLPPRVTRVFEVAGLLDVFGIHAVPASHLSKVTAVTGPRAISL